MIWIVCVDFNLDPQVNVFGDDISANEHYKNVLETFEEEIRDGSATVYMCKVEKFNGSPITYDENGIPRKLVITE
ncbi:hypothetical protein BRE01_62780 [Brevibacillus reuszeri]|uniref:Uncharacterized protein n=1 Tax=Brevibacillus reuszeri TaxID=54915 RepID=A0A0K9YW49_9BACL|nr:hypothetical protein [Brevibacillus reuszeri]KNB72959.1 hypothetical protein ADS79_14150 [Brevibacillus reuszeri]GED72576.1 hypothetical protein BRE01_62780 [Brevibacillus reuszeri]